VNSRHIDIRYFFIKDRLESDGFEVQYCPTEQMLADFFTKPLQGALFRRLRAVVMGHEHISTLSVFPPVTAPQERVGNEQTEAEKEPSGGAVEGWTLVQRPTREPTNKMRKPRKTVTYADAVKQGKKVESEQKSSLYCNNPIVRK
jgi:hypothetical protein